MNSSFSFGKGGDGSNSFSGTQIMSQQGGGYLNTSMTSDMAGADSTMTPSKNRLIPNEPSLLPVTIKQIKNAPSPAQDDAFRIDGRELHTATIVGRIVHINIESTHTSFTVDDGTGQMDVRVWTAADDSKTEDYSDLSQETYVRCIGKVKNYRDSRSMTGFSIKKITDFNEVTYHNLEAIYAHLVNITPSQVMTGFNSNRKTTNSNSNSNSNSNNNNNNNSNSNSNSNSNNNNSNNLNASFAFGNGNNGSNNNNSNDAGMGGETSNQNNDNQNGDNSMMVDEQEEPEHPPLHKKILAHLTNARIGTDDSYSGCHVDRIFDSLSGEDRNQIREALEQMSTDGSIYSTVDDETYNISLQ